ncbi:MAG: signal peptidase I [Candidatus Riflebacteria bacterium]|nr:signal peptidase I [Candidatus Riflebacteria bacterium]
MQKIKHGLRDWAKDFARALVFFLVLQTYVVQGFVIEGACMEPELHSREKIIVNKMIYKFEEPEVGEVVVFSYPLEPEKDFIKRVVGVPGDMIEIKEGYLYRNGRLMKEPFVKEYVFGTYGPQRVPDGKICVMGDNRNNSHDSRSWGLLERTMVKGRAELKFWPPESAGRIAALKE